MGRTTPRLTRGPAKAGGRRVPSTAGSSFGRDGHGVSRDGRHSSLKTESWIAEFDRYGSGSSEGARSVLARERAAHTPGRAPTCQGGAHGWPSSLEAEGCVRLEGKSSAVAESAVASPRGDTEVGSSTIRHAGTPIARSPAREGVPERELFGLEQSSGSGVCSRSASVRSTGKSPGSHSRLVSTPARVQRGAVALDGRSCLVRAGRFVDRRAAGTGARRPAKGCGARAANRDGRCQKWTMYEVRGPRFRFTFLERPNRGHRTRAASRGGRGGARAEYTEAGRTARCDRRQLTPRAFRGATAERSLRTKDGGGERPESTMRWSCGLAPS